MMLKGEERRQEEAKGGGGGGESLTVQNEVRYVTTTSILVMRDEPCYGRQARRLEIAA